MALDALSRFLRTAFRTGRRSFRVERGSGVGQTLPSDARSANDRFRPRLCENAQEPTRRRIVFSIAFFRGRPPAIFVSRLTKSGRTFCARIERQRFYTAWPRERKSGGKVRCFRSAPIAVIRTRAIEPPDSEDPPLSHCSNARFVVPVPSPL